MPEYIYSQYGWPTVTWDHQTVNTVLADVIKEQQKLKNRIEALPEFLRREANAYMLTEELLGSFELADEELDKQEIMSHFAGKVGVDLQQKTACSEQHANWANLLWDASQHSIAPLTEERLNEWHHSMFPTGRSGAYRIRVGAWRNNPLDRPLEVFWGVPPHEKVLFEAPPSEGLSKDMFKYLSWFNTKFQVDPLIKAGIAHLGFVTIHPFDDGNGRVARLITSLQLARAAESRICFYSLSAQLKKEKTSYYQMLEQTQKGTLDITEWLIWFLKTIKKAINSADKPLAGVFKKARFWEKQIGLPFNNRQIKMINRLIEGLPVKLNTSVWGEMCDCSQDTALRDIQDLLNKKVLVNGIGGGRSTHYILRENK
jgi:Fic family protein